MIDMSRYEETFVTFFGWFESSKQVFIAMEYFHSGDLERYINERLPYIQIQIIIVHLVHGLRIMHRNHFTRRDLKP